MGPGVCPSGLPAGQQLPDYVCACADGNRCAILLHDARCCWIGVAGLAYEDGRHSTRGGCACWNGANRVGAGIRQHLGSADLGGLVGIGCAHNFHSGHAVFIYRAFCLAWCCASGRGSGASLCRACDCGAGEHTDHQVLRRVVEYAASDLQPVSYRAASDAGFYVFAFASQCTWILLFPGNGNDCPNAQPGSPTARQHALGSGA